MAGVGEDYSIDNQEADESYESYKAKYAIAEAAEETEEAAKKAIVPAIDAAEKAKLAVIKDAKNKRRTAIFYNLSVASAVYDKSKAAVDAATVANQTYQNKIAADVASHKAQIAVKVVAADPLFQNCESVVKMQRRLGISKDKIAAKLEAKLTAALVRSRKRKKDNDSGLKIEGVTSPTPPKLLLRGLKRAKKKSSDSTTQL